MTQQLTEQASRHAVFVQRFAGHVANIFDPFLEEMRVGIRVLLLEIESTRGNARATQALINRIRKLQARIYADYNKELLSQLRAFAPNETEFELESIAQALNNKTINLNLATNSQIWATVNSEPLIFSASNSVKLLDPFIKDFTAKEIKRISDLIRTGIITGQSNKQIASAVTGKNGALDKVSRRATKNMVRTATNHVSNIAKIKSYSDNDDIIIGYEIVATLDGRTTDICRGFDGLKVKNSDKFQPRPPFHIGCRTTTKPTIDGRFGVDDSPATKTARGDDKDEVSTKKSYYSWIKTQSVTFQGETLGPTLGKLLRDGGLSVNEFRALTTDQLFRPITLEEMRIKNPMAFEEAGLTPTG